MGNCYSIKFNDVWILPEALHIGCRAAAGGFLGRAGWEQPRESPLAGVVPCSAFLPRSAPFTSQLPHTHQALLTFELVLNTWNNFVSTSTVSSCEPLHGNFSDTRASLEFLSPCLRAASVAPQERRHSTGGWLPHQQSTLTPSRLHVEKDNPRLPYHTKLSGMPVCYS